MKCSSCARRAHAATIAASAPQGNGLNSALNPAAAPATIVLVHGLWMSGFQLKVLQHRLESHGDFRVVSYSYPSLSGGMSDHVRGLLEADDVDDYEYLDLCILNESQVLSPAERLRY